MNDFGQMLQKTTIRFAKTGPAIFHSHHDMIRFWERAVKRAELPLRLTQGFNPRPRIVFPHALGLGITSRHEEVELELCEPVEVDELLRRVVAAAGDTLDIQSAHNLPPVKKSRQLVRSFYRIDGWSADALQKLPDACSGLLAQEEIVVERGAPGKRRSLDIRPYIVALECRQDEQVLVAELSHSTAGAARPDEIARLAAELTGNDYYALAIEKTGMVLE